MSRPRRLAVTASLAALLTVAGGTSTQAAIVFEIHTDRATFDARLGGAVGVVDFDDIPTSGDAVVPFDFDRYRFSHGAQIFGPEGQLVSRTFGLPADFPPSSPPNSYAPGPVAEVMFGGGNFTQVFFQAGMQPALVAGVGVVFIDADAPGVAPSKLEVFDAQFVIGNAMLLAGTGVVSGPDASQVFRGIVAIDDATDMPAPVIGFAAITNGQGWPGVLANEGVTLDDLVFATPVASAGIPGEGSCDDCADPDGDQYVDRLDPECPAPAFGAAAGLGDPKGRGKAIVKCQQTLAKAGASFVNAKLKTLQGCLMQVQTCLQIKFQDLDACLVKAQKKCAAGAGKIAAAETKLADAIAKSCSPAALADLLDPAGLGYAAEVAACAAHAVSPLDSAAAVALCVARGHECRVEQMVSTAAPRARELLALAGLDPADFPCIAAGAEGGPNGLGDVTRGKALLKCQKTIDKQGAGLVKNRQKRVQKCTGALFKCLQLKPGDAACLAKALAQCAKIAGTIGFADGALAREMRIAIRIVCGATDLNDLIAATGLGHDAQTDRCQDIGGGVGSAEAIGHCIASEEICRVDRLLDEQLPRAAELRVLGELVQ